MLLTSSNLTIDPKLKAENIKRHIRELLDANSADGITIGLSGGIDSAVLAALAVQAIGKNRVYPYYLYDRDSSKESRTKAKLIADWLGIELKLRDITPEMKNLKIYSPLIMKITAFSGFINRHLNTRLHCLFHRQSPFIATLRKGCPGTGRISGFFYNLAVGPVEAAFNARHIHRRKFLEQLAKEKNWLLLGAANRSESMVGWFVKDGIDDLPFSPIIGLYKTQIFQLAKYLDLPAQIQNQAPSPDMIRGITDESAMGITYDRLDVILDCIDRGLSDQQIISGSIRSKDLFLVRSMNKLSEWKREKEPDTNVVKSSA